MTNNVDSKIKKKIIKNAEDSDLTRIREIFIEELKNIEKKIEKSIFDNLINWIAKQLVIILISAFIIIIGFFYKFVSEHQEIQKLKIENQNIKIDCQNQLNDYKFIKKNKTNN